MRKGLIKKSIALLLVFSMLFSFCSCGEKKEEASTSPVKVIQDAANREVKLPANPTEATIASVYAVSVPFFCALGITDRVLAVNVKSNFWKLADANLNAAGTVGRGVVDLEKLATYAPTALVHRSNDPETVTAVEKLGVDVICITVENMDDIKSTLRMLGEYFGAEEKAEEAVSWIEEKFAYIKNIVDTIPENERKTAVLMGGELGRIAGNDMLQSWMIEQAGGICVADAGQNHNWINVGVEKLFEYNPDVIFCTSSTARSYTTEELFSDSAWSAMKAVENEEIHIIPSKNDSWDMPGISCVLGVFYMLRTMYPNYFSVEDFEDEVDSYYRFMFGRCFDDELELDWDNY